MTPTRDFMPPCVVRCIVTHQHEFEADSVGSNPKSATNLERRGRESSEAGRGVMSRAAVSAFLAVSTE
jgi:uncharacterized protein YcbX